MSPSITRFAYNDDLWREIKTRVTKAKRVTAAVAYLGKGGAKLLPLKKGDSLVVDMSLGAVRQGVTDRREIRLLMGRGVRVFSRGSLHAKFILADKTLLAGSANISRNSNEILDEAGVITTDPAALCRAKDFFDHLCTEPVGNQYLKACIAEYRPPRFKAAVERSRPGGKRSRRIVEAKLWFLGGLVRLDLSEVARKSIERLERRAQKQLKQPEQTEVDWIRYGGKPKFLRQIRKGDWIVDCMKNGNGRKVGPRAQVLSHDEWVSPRGTHYAMLMLESPSNGESMVLSDFRRRAKSVEPNLDHPNPRTRPIVDNDRADAILRMWTATGKIAKVRR
jgi:hypothetical protein